MKRVFDLEQAKKHGCWTVDGSKVEIIRDNLNNTYPILAIVTDRLTGIQSGQEYTSDGRFFLVGEESSMDLTTVKP